MITVAKVSIFLKIIGGVEGNFFQQIFACKLQCLRMQSFTWPLFSAKVSGDFSPIGCVPFQNRIAISVVL
jgi:hypothetical protein